MCNPITDPDRCVGELAGGAGGAIAGGAVDKFFQMIANGARDLLGAMSSFWMEVPSPKVASGSGQHWTGSETITSIQSWISPVGMVIFLATLSIALIKIASDTRRAGEGANAIIRSLVVTAAGGLPLLAVTMLLIQAGDAFSPWILDRASGQDVSKDGFGKIFQLAMMGSPNRIPEASGALLVIYLLAILGSAVQVAFMILRGAAIILLLCFAQVIAAGAATEEGFLRFKRIAMLVLGFALYKPVAAIVLGVGLKLMSDPGEDSSDQLINSIFGLTVIVMAALALPMVIKFVAPVAAMGSSAAFSGGAALGVAATGASIVALAGTGGGSAAAGSGAGAGASSSGANMMATSAAGSGPEGPSGANGANGGTPPPSSGGDDTSGGGGEPKSGGPSGSGSSSSSTGPRTSGAATSSPSQGSSTPVPSSQPSSSAGAQAVAPTIQNVSGLINKAGEDTTQGDQ